MGLLDDAIREHLELKRRRGADPDEVARQENEALGDPRAPAPEDADAPLAGPDVTAVTPPAAEEEPLSELDEPEAAGPPTEHDPDDDEPETPSAVAAPPDPEPWLADEPTPVEPARPAPPEPEPDPEPESAQPAGDEDVLEETPDFLQETPEHERLWFEQKPPRDFDFDS